MPQSATVVPMPPLTSTIEPATVIGSCDQDGYVRICRYGDSTDRHARMAIYPRPMLMPDDEVLVMTDSSGQAYIVGLLHGHHEEAGPVETIRMADGATVRIDRTTGQESLELYSGKDELMIEYQSPKGTVKVNAASGNIEFCATEGSILFDSAKDILIGGNRVVLDARTDVHVGVKDPHGLSGPALSMKTRKMHLTAPVLELTAQRAQLFLQETRVAGKKLLGCIGDVQLISRKIESVADTVMARAKNVYRTISELSQLKAGRQRTLVETTSHVKAGKTIMKSETDFKVKAEKIHLG